MEKYTLKTDTTLIRQLSDFVLLNAYSVDATGLYNGKAGLSVCLFETARLCKDEELEDHAFELLKESLLTVNTDIGFESGLSGVGYALLYLIRNGFLEGDPDELFGNKRQIIHVTLRAGLSDPYIYQWMPVLYYLLLLRNEPVEKELLSLYMDRIMDSLGRVFTSIEARKEQQAKTEICSCFARLLRFEHCLATTTGERVYDDSKLQRLCCQYDTLYRSGMIAGDFKADYFLRQWAGRNNRKAIRDEASFRQQRYLSCMYPSVMTLKEKIDGLFLLSEDRSANSRNIVVIENSIFHIEGMDTEQSILANLDKRDLHFSYNNGIARLLLYLVYRQALAGGENVDRFHSVFI